MKTLFALLLILLLHQSLAIKVIKGKDIPKDYSIGKLMHVDFGTRGINYEGIEKVVIAKGHDINIFMPTD